MIPAPIIMCVDTDCLYYEFCSRNLYRKKEKKLSDPEYAKEVADQLEKTALKGKIGYCNNGRGFRFPISPDKLSIYVFVKREQREKFGKEGECFTL